MLSSAILVICNTYLHELLCWRADGPAGAPRGLHGPAPGAADYRDGPRRGRCERDCRVLPAAAHRPDHEPGLRPAAVGGDDLAGRAPALAVADPARARRGWPDRRAHGPLWVGEDPWP